MNLELATRAGLPDALRVLLTDYPKADWQSDPGFDGLVAFWLDRHLMFRNILDRLNNDCEAFLDRKSPAKTFGTSVSRLGSMFVQGLHGHHQIEDTQYFPILSQKDTRLIHGFEILEKDHDAMDGILNSFVGAANDTLGGLDTANERNLAGAFHTQVTELTRLLDRHLTDEEELIVPVLLKFGTY
ncbi:MAG: hemerythrin domain-containing protein [Planktomarina sp.]